MKRFRRRKDGTLVQLSLTVSPIKNSDGQVIGASIIARDINARKRIEELQVHLGAIVESSDDAILSKDLNGIIKSWNPAAEKIFGYSANEAIGKPITMLIPPGREEEEPAILARIGKGQKVDHFETVRRRKNGSLVNISVTISPIRNAAGEVVGASKIARDITAQKEAEKLVISAQKELALANERLEQRVAERTAALQAVVEQMQEFSYSVSHDLRSPVRAMQAYATALLEDFGQSLNETGREYLQKIIRGSNKMDKLIMDVLIYSKLAQAHVETRDTDVESLLQDIIESYPEMQPPRARINIHSPLGKVFAHESSFTQALSNLLGNAVKFVSAGTVPQVDIRAEQRGERIRLWITDNGIGIDPSYQPRLFRLFERADPGPEYDGTGIGLAIVKKAIEKMGGSVGCEPGENAGTSFWVELNAVQN
jgi:PAS domain S-box-containing protein